MKLVVKKSLHRLDGYATMGDVTSTRLKRSTRPQQQPTKGWPWSRLNPSA